MDGNLASRYTTDTPQTPGMWVQIELPKTAEVTQITLDSGNSTRDYPRGFKVEASLDGKNWSKPLAQGDGTSPITKIPFSTTKARYLRITQTKRARGLYWSIHDLKINGRETASR